MGLELINRRFYTRNSPTETTFPLGNPAQLITEQINIKFDFDFESSTSISVIINDDDSFKINGESWGGLGFVVGDSVGMSYEITDSTGTVFTFSATRIVTSIIDNVITFNGDVILSTDHVGTLLPTQNIASTLKLTSSRLTPQEIDFYHNLQPNNASQSDASLIDGEVNRFIAESVDALSIGATMDLVQLGNKSGGTYESFTLTRLSDSDGNANYRILLDYLIPDIQDADFDKPDWFLTNNSIKSTGLILGYPETNNPNSELSLSYDSTQGNIGWYNEEHNQGVNDFEVQSVTIVGASGTTLSSLDPNQVNTVTAVITGDANFLNKAEAKISIIPPTDEYKNNEFSHGQNTSTAIFHIIESFSATRTSFVKNGRQITTANESIDTTTANQITVTFDVIPSAALTTYINSLQQAEQLYRMSVSVESVGGTPNNNNNVSLILDQSLFEAEPIPDQPFSGVTFQGFFNHWQDATGTDGAANFDGCTEDDFVYRSTFNLLKADVWEQLTAEIEVVRNSDGASFNLLSKTVPFSGFVTSPDGTQNIDFSQSINQYLEAPLRNVFSVKNTGVSTGTDYEVELIWSLLANWRYWIENNDAFTDFYDGAIPNNGQNAEWMRYLREAGYSIRLRIRLIRDGVAYFFGGNIVLQDYEVNLVDPDITTEITYYDQDNNLQTSLLENQEMTIRAEHTNTVGNWLDTDTVGWISQRGFETDPNKRMSTKWAWTSQNLPLKPKVGQTEAELTFPSPNVARVECLVDTSLVDVDNVSFVARIQSPAVDPEVEFTPFSFRIDTALLGASTDDQFELPLKTGETYNFIVEWGEGAVENITADTNVLHTYLFNKDEIYVINIYNTFPAILFEGIGDAPKITDVLKWGDVVWLDMNQAFEGCVNLGVWSATDVPILNAVTDFSEIFKDCSSFNNDLSGWDVSGVQDFTNSFNGCSVFNGNVLTWDVSTATDMVGMFQKASVFNQDISAWNVSNATDMMSMFQEASAFNQNLGTWNLSSLTAADSMFANSGMSTANYTDTLVGQANRIFNGGVSAFVDMANQTGMTFDSTRPGGANFATAGDARDYLIITVGWTISGDTVI